MFAVYAIYNSKHNKIYIGQTADIDLRMLQHRNKIFENSFTSKFDGDWVIIYQENVSNRKVALLREKQLKSFRGREFIKTCIPR